MKKLVALLLVLAMCLTLFACAKPVEPAPTEEPAAEPAAEPVAEEPVAEEPVAEESADPAVTLVYAEVNGLDTIVGKTAVYFKEQVEALSEGSITIDIQPNAVLGDEATVLDTMLGGGDTIDISRISAFALNSYGCTKSVLLSLPFTFTSREHFWAFANSDLAADFLNEPQTIGLPLRGIFYGEEGFRHFFTAKEISGVEDLAGMKLRVSNDPIMNGLVEGLGASPTVVAFNELYSALQTGVVDGAEQPIANYKSNAFDEVAPNMILDGHTLGAVEIVIGDNAWNKLTENQQNVLVEAGKLAMAYNQSISQEAEDEVLAGLREAGINVIDVPDKSGLQEAVAPLREEFVTGDDVALYESILALQ